MSGDLPTIVVEKGWSQEQRARRLFDDMARNIGREAVNHLKTMYPHMISEEGHASKIWETSMVNTIRNDINWRVRGLLLAILEKQNKATTD